MLYIKNNYIYNINTMSSNNNNKWWIPVTMSIGAFAAVTAYNFKYKSPPSKKLDEPLPNINVDTDLSSSMSSSSSTSSTSTSSTSTPTTSTSISPLRLNSSSSTVNVLNNNQDPNTLLDESYTEVSVVDTADTNTQSSWQNFFKF